MGCVLFAVTMVVDFLYWDQLQYVIINQHWFIFGILLLMHIVSFQLLVINDKSYLFKSKKHIYNDQLNLKNSNSKRLLKMKITADKILSLLLIGAFIMLFVGLSQGPTMSTMRFR